MEESVKERLLRYIEYKGISVNKFEKICGLSTGYVGNMRKSIQPEKAMNISHNFPDLNIGWLLSGEGEMLKSEDNNTKSQPIGIPHIEKENAFCGPGQGFDIAVMRKDCPVYNIPGAEDADFTIRAKGPSMINKADPSRSIKEGDYIACKKPRTNVIRYGEIYALATSDGIMVKVVQPCDEEGFVILESFNTESKFRPFKYPIVDIHDMALVIAVASINRLA